MNKCNYCKKQLGCYDLATAMLHAVGMCGKELEQ